MRWLRNLVSVDEIQSLLFCCKLSILLRLFLLFFESLLYYLTNNLCQLQTDKAAVLDDAIEYIKALKHQMLSPAGGAVYQAQYM
ncbi:hypothetical protein O6P43_025750 [Quillaja saponaria]|uniref:BHLH domain-containing protein n=1 Tax=Quillaja saponaria TaxID=32244 RepID=A0AAD7L9W5_QUISA|nr:hypothetical protein O6P43_025750 [Quillaja saponaria]